MKKIVALLLSVLLVCAFCALAGSSIAAAETEELTPVTLTYSTLLGDDRPGVEGVRMLARKVNEKLGGEYLTVDIYGSNTLGTGATMLDDVLSGVTDIGHILVSSHTSRLPLCALFQTPGAATFLSTESANCAFTEYLQTLQPSELDGLVVLYTCANGPGAIVTNFEAHSMDDLKGRQIRCTATTADVLKAWGCNPITLEWSECYEAMRSHLIEGIYTNTGACADGTFDDIVDYLIYAPWYNDCEIYAISRERFDSLHPAMQQAILEAAAEVQDEFMLTLKDIAVNPFPNIVHFVQSIKGIIFFPQEEVDRMSDAIAATVAETKAGELDKKGINGSEALALIRELADRNNAIPGYDDSAYKEALFGLGANVLE